MLISLLRQRHPDFDATRMEENRALYEGGESLLKSSVLDRLLHRGASEPEQRYAARKSRAHYVNHCAGLVDQFVSWLYSVEPDTTSMPELEEDEWWHAFTENCDRQKSDLNQFFAEVFREALVQRRGWVQVELPKPKPLQPANRREEEELGNLNAYLICRCAKDVTNWEYDEDGSDLLYAVIEEKTQRAQTPDSARGLVKYRWTILYPDRWERYEWVQQKKDEEPGEKEDLQPVDAGEHSFGAVPLVEFCLPKGLWILNQAKSHLVEAFNQRNALSWGAYTSLHAMPVLKSDSDKLEGKRFGGGYGLQIGSADDIFYLEPGGSAFGVAQAIIDDLKDELYRVVHLMSLAVSNDTATTLASGASKAQDKSSSEIVLGAYAQIEGKARELVLDMVARGRGEDRTWRVKPADKFSTEGTADVLSEIALAAQLNVPSRTFAVEMHKKAAHSLLKDIDEEKRKLIDREIEENTQEPGAMMDFAGGLEEGEEAGEAEGVQKAPVAASGSRQAAPVAPRGLGPLSPDAQRRAGAMANGYMGGPAPRPSGPGPQRR